MVGQHRLELVELSPGFGRLAISRQHGDECGVGAQRTGVVVQHGAVAFNRAFLVFQRAPQQVGPQHAGTFVLRVRGQRAVQLGNGLGGLAAHGQQLRRHHHRRHITGLGQQRGSSRFGGLGRIAAQRIGSGHGGQHIGPRCRVFQLGVGKLLDDLGVFASGQHGTRQVRQQLGVGRLQFLCFAQLQQGSSGLVVHHQGLAQQQARFHGFWVLCQHVLQLDDGRAVVLLFQVAACRGREVGFRAAAAAAGQARQYQAGDDQCGSKHGVLFSR